MKALRTVRQGLAVAATGVAALLMQHLSANAAPMEYVLKRGVFEVCASPDAMPFFAASFKRRRYWTPHRPRRSLARELGVAPNSRSSISASKRVRQAAMPS